MINLKAGMHSIVKIKNEIKIFARIEKIENGRVFAQGVSKQSIFDMLETDMLAIAEFPDGEKLNVFVANLTLTNGVCEEDSNGYTTMVGPYLYEFYILVID